MGAQGRSRSVRYPESGRTGPALGEQNVQDDALIHVALRWVNRRRSTRDIEQETAKNYRTVLISFAEAAGMTTPIHKITGRHIEKWFAAQTKSGIAVSTLSFRYTVIRAFFQSLVDAGRLRASPCAGITGPRRPESQPRAMPADAVSRTMAACPDARARLITSLMVQEGLRRCEVQRLQTGDIDTLERVMVVRGKGNKERWLPITEATIRALDAYLAEYPPIAGPLIRSYQFPTRGLGVERIGAIVTQAMRDAGVKQRNRDGRSPHALRHTFASDLLEGGADIEDVRQALGHTTLGPTAVYVKRLRASDKLRTIMGGRDYTGPVAAEA